MSFHLHPFAVSNLLIIIFLPPAIYILIKSKNKYAVSYALHLFTVSVWALGALIGTTTNDIDVSDISLRAGYAIGMFNSPIFLHSAYMITKKKINTTLILCYLMSLILAISTLNGTLFNQPKIYFDSFYFLNLKSKPLFLIGFIVWMLTLFYAHLIFIKFIKDFPKTLNISIKSYLFTSIGHLGAITLFLPELFNIYPWGSFSIGPIGLLITYLIFKHQAFDIKIAIEKSIIYSTLIAVISILYLIIVLALERSFSYFFNYQSVAISIAAAFGIGLLVFPLRNKIQQIMDRYFFSGTQAEIYERNLVLQTQVEQSQRLKTAAILASGLAHEIKNPLTAITTFAEYLQQKKNDPEFINNFSKIVGLEAERINGLVNQLTDFAKPANSDLIPTNIHLLIDQTLQFLTSHCLKQNITVKVDFTAPDETILKIDPKQTKQVILNILLNAIEAMPSGGEIIIKDQLIAHGSNNEQLMAHSSWQEPDKLIAHGSWHESKNPKMSDEPSAMSDQKPMYRLLIQDSGPGITENDLAHIFDPFFTKKDQGTGLGLSVSYRIIEQHGGKLSAENVTDEQSTGAVFIIEFPL